MSPPAPADPALVAGELRIVLGGLVRRLRAQHAFPISQGSVLGRIDREGPRGVSDLAAAEKVRPQSMAQTVADLEAQGLVARRPDPTDGRRQLVELTPEGVERLHADRARRDHWLARAIEEDLTEDERRTLTEAVELLRRLADAGD